MLNIHWKRVCYKQQVGKVWERFLRIRRNCHKLEDYDKYSNDRIEDYHRRVYPKEELMIAQLKARQKDRAQLFQQKPLKKKESMRTPLILTYDPANPDLRKILHKYWRLLNVKKTLFKDGPLIAYKRNRIISKWE